MSNTFIVMFNVLPSFFCSTCITSIYLYYCFSRVVFAYWCFGICCRGILELQLERAGRLLKRKFRFIYLPSSKIEDLLFSLEFWRGHKWTSGHLLFLFSYLHFAFHFSEKINWWYWYCWNLYFHREIEKLKLSEMTCRQGVIEVAKM